MGHRTRSRTVGLPGAGHRAPGDGRRTPRPSAGAGGMPDPAMGGSFYGRVVMKDSEILNKVDSELGLNDKQQAEVIVVGTLELIGQRIAGQEPSNLASQLPNELKEPLTRHTGAAETFDVDEFLRRLADHEGTGVDPE